MSTTELLVYFTAEKHGALWIAGIGIAAIILGSYLWFTASPFRAMAWPLILVALVQISIGIGLFLRTDPQVARLQEGLQSSRQATVEAELERMQKVNRSFKIVVVAEVILILVGMCLAVALRVRNPVWASVGMGLLLQAAATLIFDLFAEHRAQIYTRWLMEIQ